MVKLPKFGSDALVDAIYTAREALAADWRRPHLGASGIGAHCLRKLWYGFRWATNPKYPGRVLRLFERGDLEEKRVIRDLRMAGLTVFSVDEHGRQMSFSDLGGHFAGSVDGRVWGVPGAAKTWHLLEIKTYNDSRFKTLCRDKVKKSDWTYYVQMQAYMAKLGLKRALFVAVNKNDDSIYIERVRFDKNEALSITAKAETVIEATEPPVRITEDPASFHCKFCDHAPHCQSSKVELIERNCRTCVSATPLSSGGWRCEHWAMELDEDAAKAGCPQHIVIPTMLDKHYIATSSFEGGAEGRTVIYESKEPGYGKLRDHGGKWHTEES